VNAARNYVGRESPWEGDHPGKATTRFRRRGSYKRKWSKPDRGRYYANQVKVTQAGYIEAWVQMNERALRYQDGTAFAFTSPEKISSLLWLDGTPMEERHYKILTGWMSTRRMQTCAKTIVVQGCSVDQTHSARVVCRCCNVSICPRNQRRESQKWVSRAQQLIANTPRRKGYSFKMVTIGLKDEFDLQKDIDNHLKLRRQIYQKIFNDPKFPDGVFQADWMIGSIEQAGTPEHPHIHLHLIVYCKYLNREIIQRWLRSRDCTIPGCDHPADTRGTNHPCNGSWYIDIRQLSCWTKAKKGKCKCARKSDCQGRGVREAIKYATKPIGPGKIAVPRAGKPPTLNELAWAGQILKFGAHMYKRHRVESYGDAKPGITEIIALDGVEDAKRPRGLCADCGAQMQVIFIGWCKNIRDGYSWAKPGDAGFEEIRSIVDKYELDQEEKHAEWSNRPPKQGAHVENCFSDAQRRNYFLSSSSQEWWRSRAKAAV